MGRINFYRYDNQDGFIECEDIKNENGYGLGGGTRYFMKIWYDLEKSYLPSLGEIGGVPKSRTMLFGTPEKIQEIWDLASDKRLKEFEKDLLRSTFTYHFIKYESIDKFCNSIREYQKKYDTGEEFENIIKALEFEKEAKRSKYFTFRDSVSDLEGITVYVEDEEDETIADLLNSEEYSEFKLDKERYSIFLELEKLEEKYFI